MFIQFNGFFFQWALLDLEYYWDAVGCAKHGYPFWEGKG
jgi:hypothetical protein